MHPVGNLSSTALGTLVTLLVGQAITAIIFLIGFVPIMRRAVDKEIPAALAELKTGLSAISDKVGNVSDSLGKLREEFLQFRAASEERLKYLERRRMEEHGS